MSMGKAPAGVASLFTRRELGKAGLWLGSAALVGPGASRAVSSDENPDWPAWARTRDRLLSDADSLRRAAVDIRQFGARLDGQADDTAALERALASEARAIVIPAGPAIALRLTRQVTIDRSVALLGAEQGARIVCDGDYGAAFLIAPRSGRADDFVRDIHFDKLIAERPASLAIGGVLIAAYSVRGLYITRCRTLRISLAVVRHMRQKLNLYSRGKGSKTVDPAVAAGFSATATNDLSEDIYLCDNRVDFGKYQGAVLRFEFARRVVATGNIGNHAKISWWGGGARMSEGGALSCLRRVRDVYVADNILNGCNGGVYGNNGQHVVVARNRISDMTDVGVDFEGCMDCQAYGNDVRSVGNFCYATFYAAKNIEFRDNYGEQDGSGAGLWKRFGAGRYGGSKGIFLAAMRSANFSKVEGAVNVSFVKNHFRWSAPTDFGACAASFFTRLSLVENRFENVLCDWRYRLTKELTIKDNLFRFSNPAGAAQVLVAGAAAQAIFEGNRIRLAQPLPKGSASLAFTVLGSRVDLLMARNEISGTGVSSAPLAVEARRPIHGSIIIRANTVVNIALDQGVKAMARLDANASSGSAAQITPLIQALPEFR